MTQTLIYCPTCEEKVAMPEDSKECVLCGNPLGPTDYTFIVKVQCNRFRCEHFKRCIATQNATLSAFHPQLSLENLEIGCADYKEVSKYKAAT